MAKVLHFGLRKKRVKYIAPRVLKPLLFAAFGIGFVSIIVNLNLGFVSTQPPWGSDSDTDFRRNIHHSAAMELGLKSFLAPVILDRSLMCYKLDGIQIGYCPIEKNANTVFRSLFCRAALHNDSGFDVDVVDYHITQKYCTPKVETRYKVINKQFAQIIKSDYWVKLVVVRDPIDRFLSSFIYACTYANRTICYGCPQYSLGCVAERNYHYMRKTQKHGRLLGRGLDISDQIQHFWPQYWYCNLSRPDILSEFNVFRVRKDSESRQIMREQLLALGLSDNLTSTGWGAKMDRPFLDIKVDHQSTSDQIKQYKRQLFTNLKTLNYVFLTYLGDMYYFNYTIPKNVKLLCEETKETFEICYADQHQMYFQFES